MRPFETSHLYDLRNCLSHGGHNIITRYTEVRGHHSALPSTNTVFEGVQAAIKSVAHNMANTFGIYNPSSVNIRLLSFISDEKHHLKDPLYGESHRIDAFTTAIFLNLSSTTNLYKQLPLYELRMGHEEWHLKSGQLTDKNLYADYNIVQQTSELLADEFTVLINGEGFRQLYADYLKKRNLSASSEHPSDAARADSLIKGKYTKMVVDAVDAKKVKGTEYNYYVDAINAQKLFVDSTHGKY